MFKIKRKYYDVCVLFAHECNTNTYLFYLLLAVRQEVVQWEFDTNVKKLPPDSITFSTKTTLNWI